MDNRDDLKEDERFVEEIETLAEIGGWELQDDTNSLRWTAGTKAIFGVPESYSPSLTEAIDFFHPDDREHMRHAVDMCRNEGTPYDFELRILTDDGKTRWVRTRGERVDAESTIRGVIQDITAEKRRRQQLAVLNRALRHNLRNDLNVVKGYAKLLEEELDTFEVPVDSAKNEMSELTAALNRVTEESSADLEHLTSLIDAVESFSETQAKTYTATIQEKSDDLVNLGQKANDFAEWIESAPPPKPIALAPILTRIVEAVQTDIPTVSISIDCDEQAVAADPTGLKLLFEEAVRNAIEHGDTDTPKVEISVKSRESDLEIAVIDNGPGIPSMEKDVLARGRESPLSHSNGIGLWMMNWIATGYGGDFDIRSNPAGGTIVRISLPQAPI